MKHFNVVRRVFASLVALTTLLASANAQTVTVVEYRNKTLDAYFITGRIAEQQLLDTAADFSRTGMSFQASEAGTTSSALTKICRFYVSLTNPFVNSHFYGKQGTDCESILAINPAGFSYEGYDFAVQGSATEICPDNMTAVRRSFRALANGKTSNHRYTVSAATAANAAEAGYVVEGVQFCVKLFTDITPTVGIAMSWMGSATSIFAPQNINAQVTWTLESVVDNVATYRPSGIASVSGGAIVQICNLTPSSGTIKPTGILMVDYKVSPPTYRGGGSTSWPSLLSCPPNPAVVPTTVTALYFGGNGGQFATEATGSVSADGTTIAGTDTVGGSNTLTWQFRRN